MIINWLVFILLESIRHLYMVDYEEEDEIVQRLLRRLNTKETSLVMFKLETENILKMKTTVNCKL
jgi:hypothetical protein